MDSHLLISQISARAFNFLLAEPKFEIIFASASGTDQLLRFRVFSTTSASTFLNISYFSSETPANTCRFASTMTSSMGICSALPSSVKQTNTLRRSSLLYTRVKRFFRSSRSKVPVIEEVSNPSIWDNWVGVCIFSIQRHFSKAYYTGVTPNICNLLLK